MTTATDEQIAEIKAGLAGVTPGPWQTVETAKPYHVLQSSGDLKGNHTERRIFTTWLHPQFKDWVAVVKSASGLSFPNQRPHHFVSIRPEDAAHIARLDPQIVAAILERLEKAELGLKTVQNAARTLAAAKDAEISSLRKPAREYRTAVATLDSERAANALLTDRAEAAEDALAAAIKQIGELSREAGEAKGALHASENYNLINGWRERAEKAEAENARLRAALIDCEKWFSEYADGHVAKGDTDSGAKFSTSGARPRCIGGEMTDIPEDVMRAAREASAAKGDSASSDILAGRHDGSIDVQAAARAIMAERERCAKVAEGLDPVTGERGQLWTAHSLYDNMRKHVAAVIRRGE